MRRMADKNPGGGLPRKKVPTPHQHHAGPDQRQARPSIKGRTMDGRRECCPDRRPRAEARYSLPANSVVTTDGATHENRRSRDHSTRATRARREKNDERKGADGRRKVQNRWRRPRAARIAPMGDHGRRVGLRRRLACIGLTREIVKYTQHRAGEMRSAKNRSSTPGQRIDHRRDISARSE